MDNPWSACNTPIEHIRAAATEGSHKKHEPTKKTVEFHRENFQELIHERLGRRLPRQMNSKCCSGSLQKRFWPSLARPETLSKRFWQSRAPPESGLGAARARFWRPKHRAKSGPGAILVTLTVKERFGDDFLSIFDYFRSLSVAFRTIFGRPWSGS